MIKIVLWLLLALAATLLPAFANTITITCPSNNCTVSISGCSNTLNLSQACNSQYVTVI